METPVTVKLKKIGSRVILLTVRNNNKEKLYEYFLHTNQSYRLEKRIGDPMLYFCELDIGTFDGDDVYKYENTEEQNIAFNNFVKLLKQYKKQYPGKIILHYL